jgi:putative oxidoreductase
MKEFLRSLPAALLILLFVYAVASKLADFAIFRIQLNRQTIPRGIAPILVYALPAGELAAVALLLFQRTALKGLYLSLLLLSIFTLYIALVVLHFWSRVPCPCGGILTHMSWTVHLAFNLLFIAINLIAIHIQLKERRAVTSE